MGHIIITCNRDPYTEKVCYILAYSGSVLFEYLAIPFDTFEEAEAARDNNSIASLRSMGEFPEEPGETNSAF